MSKFPVYRIGSTFWDSFGADGFNEYGYNEQGYDRKGNRYIVLAARCNQAFAQDDSYDAMTLDKNEIASCDVSGAWVTDFFFVPEEEHQGNPLYAYICYSQDAAAAIQNNDWRLAANYVLVAGFDQELPGLSSHPRPGTYSG